MASTDLALGEEDLNLNNMDMSLEDADLFKYFLTDDLSNIEGTFRSDFESSLSDISGSPQTSPTLPNPESPEFASYLNTSSYDKDSSSDEVKVKKEPNDKSDSKKRGREDKKSLALSRDDLLKLSSKGLENYAQNLAATRPLTQEEERQLKRQRRLIKNRESAQLSRLRKKIYIEELERKLSHMSQQNENLSKQVQSLQVDKKKLAEEVLYLQNVIKQSPQLTAVAAQGKKHAMPRNVKAAGVCLLIVLFSFGLLFNASTQSNLPFSAKREEIPEVIPKASLYTGRVLKSIKEEESLVSKVSLGKEPQDIDRSNSISLPSKVNDSPEPKRKKMKISEESDDSNKSLVPLETSQMVRARNNTSYIFCPQAQHVLPASTSDQNPGKPDVVALLIPSNMLNGNLMANYSPEEMESSMLEVSCQVLSLNIWPISNSTN